MHFTAVTGKDEENQDDFPEEATEADAGETENLQGSCSLRLVTACSAYYQTIDYDEPQQDQYDELGDLEDGIWELEDEDEEPNPQPETHDNTFSKQSSETLSTLSSKRSRDEDDEGEATLSESSPDSPGSFSAPCA